jgi:type 2A phosphatase activator TIP41
MARDENSILDSAARSAANSENLPLASLKPSGISRKGFKITTHKLPILKAGPIEDMANRLGITPPEMIFGDNFVTIEHEASGWGITFNAFDALDQVDKSGATMLKVAYSKEWQKSRCQAPSLSPYLPAVSALTQVRENTHEGIKEVVKPFDWSYSTGYQGTLYPTAKRFEPSTVPIPIELLKRPDPILFFDDVMLYEDELADNGISILSCKVRVMPSRLLLLSRFFMRLDNVLFRLRDTRVYVDFDSSEVIREYQSRELEYERVRQVCPQLTTMYELRSQVLRLEKVLASARKDVPAVMRDPNRLVDILPLVEKKLQRVDLSTPISDKEPPSDPSSGVLR